MPGVYTAGYDRTGSWIWSLCKIPDTDEIIPTSNPDKIELEVTINFSLSIYIIF